MHRTLFVSGRGQINPTQFAIIVTIAGDFVDALLDAGRQLRRFRKPARIETAMRRATGRSDEQLSAGRLRQELPSSSAVKRDGRLKTGQINSRFRRQDAPDATEKGRYPLASMIKFTSVSRGIP